MWDAGVLWCGEAEIPLLLKDMPPFLRAFLASITKTAATIMITDDEDVKAEDCIFVVQRITPSEVPPCEESTFCTMACGKASEMARL